MGWNIFKWLSSSKKTSSENDKKSFKLNESKDKENKYTPFSGNTIDKTAFSEKTAKANLLTYMKNPNGVNNKNQFVTHVVKALNNVVKSRNDNKEKNKKTGINKMLEALKDKNIGEQIKILSSGRVDGQSIIGWFSFWDSSMQKAFSNGVKNLQDKTTEEKTKKNLGHIKSLAKEEGNKNISTIPNDGNKEGIKLKVEGNEGANKGQIGNNKDEHKKTNENTESNIKKLEEEKLKLKNETIIEKKENNEISGTEDKIILIENGNSNANNKNEDIKIEGKQTNNEENIKEEIPEQKDNENQEVKIEIIENVPESKAATTVLTEFKNNLDKSLEGKTNIAGDELTKIICETMVKINEKEQSELVTVNRKNKSNMEAWFRKNCYSKANKFAPAARYKKQHLIQSLTNALFSGNIKEKLEYLRIYKNGELLGNKDLKSLKKEEKIEIIELHNDDEKKQIAEEKSENNNKKEDAIKQNEKNDNNGEIEPKIKQEKDEKKEENKNTNTNQENKEKEVDSFEDKSNDIQQPKQDLSQQVMSKNAWITAIKGSVAKNAKNAASYQIRGQNASSYWYADQLLYGLCKSLINEKTDEDKSDLVNFVKYAEPKDLENAIVELFKQIFDSSSGFYKSYASYWSYNNCKSSKEYAEKHPGYEDKLIDYVYFRDKYTGGTINSISEIAASLKDAANGENFEGSLKGSILETSGNDVVDKYKSTNYAA